MAALVVGAPAQRLQGKPRPGVGAPVAGTLQYKN